MAFAFGSASALYAQARHPRLLTDARALTALRRALGRQPGPALIAALHRRVEPYARQILATRDLPGLIQAHHTCFWPKPGEQFLWALHDLALLGRLEGRGEMTEAVARVCLALPDVSEWVGGKQSHGPWYYLPPLFVPLAYDLIADKLPEADRARFAAWALARYVRAVLTAQRGRYLKNTAHNMSIGAMEIALTTLLCVQGEPGVPDLTAERTELVRWFEATLHTAIGPDGYPEEDTGYGNVVVGCLAQVAEMLRRAGVYDVYRACPRFARYGRAMLHVALPWGEALMATGDHGDQMRDREFVLARLAAETRDPTLLWLLGALSYAHNRTFISDLMPDFECEAPLRPGFRIPPTALALLTFDTWRGAVRPPAAATTPTAFCDRGRGLVSFRSGWDADATLAIFDGSQRSPAAPGHYHDSSGHFTLAALGEYFAIHAARYNIEQDCHNVVLIDGLSGRSTDGQWSSSNYHGLLIDYRPDPFCDFAAADSSHQHHSHWARRYFGLVKHPPPPELRGDAEDAPAYAWTVEDINKANDWAEFWWQLHTSPENTIVLHETHATLTGWRRGHHLDVHFALPDPASYPKAHTLTLAQDLATPSSYKYVGQPEAQVSRFARPADMLHGPVFVRPRLLAKVAGYNGRFLSLLIPRRRGAPSARVERLPARDNSLAVRIAFPRVEDILIFAYEHHLLEAGEVGGRGQWCVVRRDRASGRVLAWALGHGTALRAGGRQLLQA